MSFQSAHPTPAGVSLSTFVGRLIPFQPTDGGMHSRSENQGRRPQTRVPLHATSWSRRSRRSCGSPPCPPERAFSLRVYPFCTLNQLPIPRPQSRSRRPGSKGQRLVTFKAGSRIRVKRFCGRPRAWHSPVTEADLAATCGLLDPAHSQTPEIIAQVAAVIDRRPSYRTITPDADEGVLSYLAAKECPAE
jgi:hypothetical protein